jgi:hypothetical protein
MAKSVHSGGARKPVLIAIVSTLAVSALCQVGYHRLVADPTGRATSKSAHSPCAEAGRIDAPPPGAVAQNPVLTAALVNAALDARDAARASREKEVDAPTDEGEPVELSEEERLAIDSADLARAKARMDKLEALLGEEEVDPWWAPRTEQATTKAAATIANVRLGDVTCRETFCRVRLTHRDPTQRDGDVTRLLDTADLSASETFFQTPQADAAATVLYFSRKGHALSPLFDPPAPPLPPLPAFPKSEARAENRQ